MATVNEPPDPADPLQVAPSEPSSLFYGWWIVGVAFLIQFLLMGSVGYCVGILLKPITEELGISRFAMTTASSFGLFLPSLMGPWIGRVADRRSVKLLMMVGVVLLSLGLAVLSQATKLWHVYMGLAVFVSVGFGFAGTLPISTLIAKWFSRLRGTALGVAQFGSTFAGVLLVPLFSYSVEVWGWRAATLGLATLPLMIVLPLIGFFIVNRPEDRGLFSDGDSTPPVAGREAGLGDDWTIRRALANRQVWLLSIVVGVFFSISVAMISIMHSLVTDRNFAAGEAAGVIALMTAVGAIAKPTFGVAADRLNKRFALAISLMLEVIGLSLLLQADSLRELWVAALIFGAGYGGVMPLFGATLGAMFGRDHFGRMMGIMGPIMLPLQLIGPPMATWIYDQTGSYDGALWAFLGMLCISAIALSMLRVPSR